MKLILTISAMILFLITGCESGKQPANDFLTVDITANYPKKELILQDFLDVEYIPLETNEEFITSASMQAIGKNRRYIYLRPDRKRPEKNQPQRPR